MALRRLLPPPWGRTALFGLVALLVALCAAFAYHALVSPSRLRVAVGPGGTSEARLIEAFAKSLEERKRDVRLDVVQFDDLRAAAEALEHEAVDLAVARPDVSLPSNGLTLAILREDPVVLLAPVSGKIDKIAKLSGKRVGVVSDNDHDLATISALLAHFDLAPPAVTLMPIAAEEVENALAARRIDAVAIIGLPVSVQVADVVKAVAKAGKGNVDVISFPASDALAQKMPGLAAVEIPAGSFGGTVAAPKEAVKTVATSYRLMARLDSNRMLMAKATQYLFRLRTYIARSAPAAHFIKAPDNDSITSDILPVHQGAIDYYNREQQTFMDRYGDFLWLALFAGGGLSSVLAWLGQNMARRQRELIDKVLDRLLCILTEAREAKSHDQLNQLTMEIDDLVTHAVRHARWHTTNTRTMNALVLALDSARTAVADRRLELEQRRPERAEKRSVGRAVLMKAD